MVHRTEDYAAIQMGDASSVIQVAVDGVKRRLAPLIGGDSAALIAYALVADVLGTIARKSEVAALQSELTELQKDVSKLGSVLADFQAARVTSAELAGILENGVPEVDLVEVKEQLVLFKTRAAVLHEERQDLEERISAIERQPLSPKVALCTSNLRREDLWPDGHNGVERRA